MTHACAYQKQIDKMRRHRLALELALREGLSLDAARERLASLAVHRQRLAAPPPPAPPPAPPPLWYQRDDL